MGRDSRTLPTPSSSPARDLTGAGPIPGDAPTLTRGAVYCREGFKPLVQRWHVAEVDRQHQLGGKTATAAIRKLGERLLVEKTAAAGGEPVAPRVQPRRRAKRRTVEELLQAERQLRRSNKKKREGDYVLSALEMARALYFAPSVAVPTATVLSSHVDAESVRLPTPQTDTDGSCRPTPPRQGDAQRQLAAAVFVERVDEAVADKLRDMRVASELRIAAGQASEPECALKDVPPASCSADCVCRGRAGGSTPTETAARRRGVRERIRRTGVTIPPRAPEAAMIATASLGNWPDLPSLPRGRGGSAAKTKGKGKRALDPGPVEYLPSGTAKRRRIVGDACVGGGGGARASPVAPVPEGEDDVEDVERNIVAVGGLRFVLDRCQGRTDAPLVLML